MEGTAERNAAALAALEAQLKRAGAFSRASEKSLRRDPSGEGLVAAKPSRRRLLARRLGVAILVLALSLVLIPPFAWPIRGHVSSGFFFRHSPDSSELLDYEFHKGIDIAAASGSPVLATAPGLVTAAGHSPTAGNYVIVRHLLGFESRYYHLSATSVRQGQLILFPWFSPLGRVGTTGRSTGPHLHFELEAGSLPLPPRALLAFHSFRLWLFGF